jgi:hypothetical protein
MALASMAGVAAGFAEFFHTSQPPETTKPLKTEVIQGLSFLISGAGEGNRTLVMSLGSSAADCPSVSEVMQN